MKIYNRAYDDKQNDFKKMWDFLIDDYFNKKGKLLQKNAFVG